MICLADYYFPTIPLSGHDIAGSFIHIICFLTSCILFSFSNGELETFHYRQYLICEKKQGFFD